MLALTETVVAALGETRAAVEDQFPVVLGELAGLLLVD